MQTLKGWWIMGIAGTGRNGDDWSAREAAAKAFAGTLGIMGALAIDYFQKGADSALMYGTQLVNQYALARFGVSDLPPFIYILILIVAGFAMVYIFEPSNKRNAFYAGAGVLGALATFSPVQETSLELTPASYIEAPAPNAESGASLNFGAPVVPAAWRPFGTQKAYQPAQASALPVRVMIQFPKSQSTSSMPGISAALHDFNTDRTYKLGTGGRLADSREGPLVLYDLVITPGAPVGNVIAKLGLRVEAQGYTIGYTENAVTSSTASPAVVEVTMTPSNLPLSIERLRHPRKF